MSLKSIAFLFGLLLILLSCTKPVNSSEQLLRIPIVSQVDNLERDFFLYLPKGYGENPDKKWPLMLFLHGNGERGDGKKDLDYVMIHGPLYEAWIQKRDLPFIMIAPQLPMFGMDTIDYIANRKRSSIPQRLEVGTPPRPDEFPTREPMSGVAPSDKFPDGRIVPPAGWEVVEADLITMLDQVVKDYQVDQQRVYLTGLSYGGYGTWYLASKHTERFAAIAPVVGWGHPSLMQPIAGANLPVWVFAGGRDGAVPLKYFFAGVNRLEELGHTKLQFTIHEDMGHDVWRRVYGGQDLYDWLLQHKKEEGVVNKPKYSLAQWSFNEALFSGEMTTVDYIKIAGEMGFAGVEYVSQFFQDKVEDFAFLDSLNAATKAAGIKSLLIMIDHAGNLGASDLKEREQAIENHKKWVLAAKYLGCTSIRINAHGDGTPDAVKTACIDGIGRLAKWARQEGIEILIENHGGISNDGAWLVELLKALEPYGVGALPDFDNWCIEREEGKLWGAPCTKRYDRYQGLEELMPYARALSVKSFAFDEAGNETTMDYARFFKIIQASAYNGYLGIEFEGHDLPAKEGIQKTRALVEKVWN